MQKKVATTVNLDRKRTRRTMTATGHAVGFERFECPSSLRDALSSCRNSKLAFLLSELRAPGLQEGRQLYVTNYTLSECLKGCRLRMACMQCLIQHPSTRTFKSRVSPTPPLRAPAEIKNTCNPKCRKQ